MNLHIEVEDNASSAIRDLIRQGIPTARQSMVNGIATDVLNQTAAGNPVRTGRSQNAWNTAASQLSGDGIGSSIGGSGQSAEGSASTSHDETTTQVAATNHVPYVSFLEYGTSKMAPFAMLRRSLATVIGRIGGMFRLSN